MALKISSKISDTAWSDIDKTAIGNNLAAAWAKGGVTKAQIKVVYLYVPDEAFGKDVDGNPTFAYTKCSFPIAEVSATTITINRNGVHAAAQRLSAGSNLTGADLTAAKRRLRGLYRKLKETPPDAIKESLSEPVKKLSRPATELVKGSAEYALGEIGRAFGEQFQTRSPYSGDFYCPWAIVDTFADAIVVRAWGDMNDLAPDEYYRITYTKNADGTYTFADEADWEVVELTYQPQTGAPIESAAAIGATEALSADERKRLKAKGQRVIETFEHAITFNEALTDDSNPNGPWRITMTGTTADLVNGNRRRYLADACKRAVADLNGHITESAGQGRLSIVTGESDHPEAKGNRRPLYSEIVVNWNNVGFNGKNIVAEGLLLGTREGQDIRARAKGGVYPAVSQRAYIETRPTTVDGEAVEDVINFMITGFDFVVPGEQSDPNGAVHSIETQNLPGEIDMKPEEIAQWVKDHPELFEGLVTGKTMEERLASVQSMATEQLKALETSIRKALGIDDKADLGTALKAAAEALKAATEQAQAKVIADAIKTETKDLPYGEKVNALFIVAVESAKPADVEAVKAIVKTKRAEYDGLVSESRLAARGFHGGVSMTAPVIESALGIPGFARGAHEVSEALVKRGYAERRNWKEPKTRNELYAAAVLERFDQQHGYELRQESRLFEATEAEMASNLSLPYSVNRAIIAEVIPQLVASSVFDFGVTDQNPTLVYYETFAGETGLAGTVTDEAVTAHHNVWTALAHKRLTGTIVVTSSPAGTTYTEFVDYVIDATEGQFKALSTGAITDLQALLVDYSYTAIRKGEMAAIERGGATLASVTITCYADRLAEQISREAVVFSRSQLGWDATTRILSMLIGQIRRIIDYDAMYLARSAACSVASNSGGTWTAATDSLDKLVEYIGVARVKIEKRFYQPTAILMSTGNADILGNWEGFTAAGTRGTDNVNANGYVGSLKGLPVFRSTEFPDSHILPLYRDLVQHRVFQPMAIFGPYPTYDVSGGTAKLIAADQYYVEEFNAEVAPVPGMGAVVVIA